MFLFLYGRSSWLSPENDNVIIDDDEEEGDNDDDD